MLYLFFFYKRLKNNDSYFGVWGMLTLCYALHVQISFSQEILGFSEKKKKSQSQKKHQVESGGGGGRGGGHQEGSGGRGLKWIEGEEECRDRDKSSQVQ